MTSGFPARPHVAAALIALLAMLMLRAWLQVELLRNGNPPRVAADLSYLATAPVLLLLLAPVLWRDRAELTRRFRLPALHVIASAIAIGALLRLTWWLQLVAGVAFGWAQDPAAIPSAVPVFTFSCEAAQVVVLGFVVMVLLTPAIEELVHRGYVQSALAPRGPVIAIGVSASVFALFHPIDGWLYTAFAGTVLGALYWRSGNLWPSVLAHATVNGLIQFDWHCLNGRWNPPPDTAGLWLVGALASLLLLGAAAAIIILLHRQGRGAPRRPGQPLRSPEQRAR